MNTFRFDGVAQLDRFVQRTSRNVIALLRRIHIDDVRLHSIFGKLFIFGNLARGLSSVALLPHLQELTIAVPKITEYVRFDYRSWAEVREGEKERFYQRVGEKVVNVLPNVKQGLILKMRFSIRLKRRFGVVVFYSKHGSSRELTLHVQLVYRYCGGSGWEQVAVEER